MVKVKVMHIQTANILEMMKIRQNYYAIRCEIIYGLSIVIFIFLTLTSSKDQGQGYAHFNEEYLGNGYIHDRNCYYRQIARQIWVFYLDIYI